MFKTLVTICFVVFFNSTFATATDCRSNTDNYYEQNIIGTRLESEEITLFGKTYVAITTFNPDHSYIGKLVNKADHNDAVKAVIGEWTIKDGKLYENTKTSYLIFPIPNSIDEIICMNATTYKAMHADKTTYTSTKL